MYSMVVVTFFYTVHFRYGWTDDLPPQLKNGPFNPGTVLQLFISPLISRYSLAIIYQSFQSRYIHSYNLCALFYLGWCCCHVFSVTVSIVIGVLLLLVVASVMLLWFAVAKLRLLYAVSRLVLGLRPFRLGILKA